MVELENVTKIIRHNSVLKSVSFKFEKGNVYGIKGVNGSGKTMLLRMISGLIYPTEGKVLYEGKILGKEISFPESIGVLIENPSFIDSYTGFNNLKLLTSLNDIVGDDEIRETLLRVGLEPDDKRKYKKYSLGMKQRLGIAAAIVENPEIILFDEPLNALDTKGVELFDKIIKEEKQKGKLIIMTCHDEKKLYSYSNKILFMENGVLKEVEELE